MKNLNLHFIFSLLIVTALLSGCASAGLTASSHVTNVQLSQPNFKVVATNISGQASSRAMLGFSLGVGLGSTQVALIPLGGDKMLYQTAIKNLWSNFEANNGAVANRKLAMVNVRYDSETLNLLLYTKVTTAIVADIVEFQ